LQKYDFKSDYIWDGGISS